jgi:hypothetical protein
MLPSCTRSMLRKLVRPRGFLPGGRTVEDDSNGQIPNNHIIYLNQIGTPFEFEDFLALKQILIGPLFSHVKRSQHSSLVVEVSLQQL